MHYMPLTMHPLFVPYKAETPIADTLWRELVTLPLFPDLTDEEVAYVLESVQSYAP